MNQILIFDCSLGWYTSKGYTYPHDGGTHQIGVAQFNFKLNKDFVYLLDTQPKMPKLKTTHGPQAQTSVDYKVECLRGGTHSLLGQLRIDCSSNYNPDENYLNQFILRGE